MSDTSSATPRETLPVSTTSSTTSSGSASAIVCATARNSTLRGVGVIAGAYSRRVREPAGPTRRGGATTSQGHPRAIYERAIERENLVVAEAILRELGRPTLVELLELTALIAKRDPRRHKRVAARWVFRYLQEDVAVTLDDLQGVVGCLAALGGPRHDEALLALLAMAEEVASHARRAGG
jgi:hypothetical protein